MLNGKPWLTSPSEYRSIKIPDLLGVVGARHRLVDEQTPQADVEELLATPILPHVMQKLDERRERSRAWLDAALA
jgi:hypothetical protein